MYGKKNILFNDLLVFFLNNLLFSDLLVFFFCLLGL
jgi:hypothetical protein